MGVIQNSINGALGTVAAGLTIGKKLGGSEDNSLNEANIMLKDADAKEDLGKLQQEYSAGSAELNMWKQGKVDVGNGNYMDTNDDLTNDIKMRVRALKVLKEKITARKLQIGAYKEMLGGKQ